MRLSVTEAAVGARCERQFVLAREGLRTAFGGESASIGRHAHEILASFVARFELQALPVEHAVVEAFHGELYDRAAGIAPTLSAEDFLRLARAVFDCAALCAELIVRAQRKGLPVRAALEASEQRIALDFDGVEIEGAIDLVCRDAETGERYVFDLKTGLSDAAAEEQARIYGQALQATPALACISGDRFELKRVAPDPALGERMQRLGRIAAGEATPAAAPVETCVKCPVQSACWSRWGKTLAEPRALDGVADEVKRLEQALRAHRVHLEPIDPANVRLGPNLIRFRIALRAGEGIAKVRRAAVDLQRTMGWQVPPLVANDGHFVSLDAPRADREVLPWSALPLEELGALEVPVGLTMDRALLKLDLAQAPHLLVAGTTGSGKTVFLKGLVLSLLQRGACEVAIVDPKMLDFASFAQWPLWRPVVTDVQEAVARLQSLAEEELPRRLALIKEAGATQRSEVPSLSALVVVIDEFADLLSSFADRASRAQFLLLVQRLLQKSRAVGIHLVIATQRPSVDAIPGILKANLPTRIAFRLPQAADSGTVLDEAGAENLLGCGDLLLKRDGQTLRAQAFSVSPKDLARG